MEEKTIYEFYEKAIKKNFQKFTDEICGIARIAEDLEEKERQRYIMEDMMYVFDEISMEGKGGYACELFNVKMNEFDDLTNWQLKQIGGLVHDHYPNVMKSINTINEEGY